jgi:hypothetical protein
MAIFLPPSRSQGKNGPLEGQQAEGAAWGRFISRYLLVTQSVAVWLLIALALVSANLPFLTEKIFVLLPYRRSGDPASKPFWLRLVEVLVFYFAVGAIGFAFESSLGNRFAQGWQFYAITLCLYLVMAYPGFVYRYLFQRRP